MLRIVLKSIQKFDSHVKFFLIVVCFQAASASCLKFKSNSIRNMRIRLISAITGNEDFMVPGYYRSKTVP